jgi:ABC-type phosphate/phosphonate transport system substrate-binding protein
VVPALVVVAAAASVVAIVVSSAVQVAVSAVLVVDVDGKEYHSPSAIAADDSRSHSYWRHPDHRFGFAAALR